MKSIFSFIRIKNEVKNAGVLEIDFAYDIEFMGGQYEEVPCNGFLLGFGMQTQLSKIAYIDINSESANFILEKLSYEHKIGYQLKGSHSIESGTIKTTTEELIFNTVIDDNLIVRKVTVIDRNVIELNNGIKRYKNKLKPTQDVVGASELNIKLLGKWQFLNSEKLKEDKILEGHLKNCYPITNEIVNLEFLHNGESFECFTERRNSPVYKCKYKIIKIYGEYFNISSILRDQKSIYLAAFENECLVMFGISIFGLEKGYWKRVEKFTEKEKSIWL